jgi:hypothetical protein
MLRNKTVGLIGFGQIARAVVGRLIGWNLTIQAYTRRIRDDAPDCVHFVGLDDLLRTSDVVCVLSILNDESRNLLNADGCASSKKTLYWSTRHVARSLMRRRSTRRPGRGLTCASRWIPLQLSRFLHRVRYAIFQTPFSRRICWVTHRSPWPRFPTSQSRVCNGSWLDSCRSTFAIQTLSPDGRLAGVSHRYVGAVLPARVRMSYLSGFSEV